MSGPLDNSENAKTKNGLLLQIAALESEIAQTQAVLLDQQEQHRRLRSQLNSLSTINQLPAEIKTEIFHKTLGPLPGIKFTEEEEGETPLFIGKICQSFRYFVWSTPILWTAIRLRLTKARYEAQTELLRDWLSRTSNYPISFSLDTVEGLPWRSHPPVEILTLLASVSPQWKEARLLSPHIAFQCFDNISAVGKSLPLLTAAYLTFDRQLDLSTAPQLSVLHLKNFSLPAVLAPWHQLRELFADNCPLDKIRLIFFNVPQIVRCTVKTIAAGPIPLRIDLIHQQVLVLEHLEYLELELYIIYPEMSWILEQVKFPSLREVSLNGPFGSTPEETFLLQIVKPFRSSKLLEVFALYDTKKSSYSHVLTQVLKDIPSVKDLSLGFCKESSGDEFFNETLLQRLSSPHADIILPNLQHFSYCGPTALTEHMHLFRDVLVNRFRQCELRLVDSEQRAISQIQSVNVTSFSHFVISPDIQEDLDTLRCDGLQLSIMRQT